MRHLTDNSLISDCEGYEGALFCERRASTVRGPQQGLVLTPLAEAVRA